MSAATLSKSKVIEQIKKIDPSKIGYISYDYRTSEMKIFNKKQLLIYHAFVSEKKFNEAGKKLLDFLVSEHKK